jgi:hypothetical protein
MLGLDFVRQILVIISESEERVKCEGEKSKESRKKEERWNMTLRDIVTGSELKK